MRLIINSLLVLLGLVLLAVACATGLHASVNGRLWTNLLAAAIEMAAAWLVLCFGLIGWLKESVINQPGPTELLSECQLSTFREEAARQGFEARKLRMLIAEIDAQREVIAQLREKAGAA